MKFQAPPRNPGPASWRAIVPATENLPVLNTAEVVEWPIISAGFAGLSAARRFQQEVPNDRIIVL